MSLVFADPPRDSRGRVSIWETERFPQLLDHVGEWVDATRTWGTPGHNSSYVKYLADRLDLKIEATTRTIDRQRHLFVRAI